MRSDQHATVRPDRSVVGYDDDDPQPTDELLRAKAPRRAMVLGALVDITPTVLATLRVATWSDRLGRGGSAGWSHCPGAGS